MSILKIDKTLLHSRKKAAELLEKMQNRTYGSAAELHEDLYPFILYKYLLYDSAQGVYDITELSELSVARAIQLEKRDAFKADSEASCDGVTSSMNKKILLYVAIQKGFDITFPKEKTAYFSTTQQIAETVFELIRKKTDGSEKRQSIQEEQRQFIETFNELDDWLIQYNALLQVTSEMEKLDESERTNGNRVYSCQAKLWLVMEYSNGKIYVRADSESLIVKGIVGVIVALFNDRTPREIRKADIEFIDKTCIAQQISTDRYHGMQIIIHKIKSFADLYL